MNYSLEEISYASACSGKTIHAKIYIPKDKAPIGILQLSHGMIDYVGRYEALADYLTGEGYIFAGNCHLGHGKSAGSEEELGYFADESALDYLCDDLHSLNSILKERYPTLPIAIMGHSMGSFISRLYVNKYPQDVSGHIIHGTGGPMPGILPLGKLLVKLFILARGRRYRSSFVASVAFMGYNSKFDKSEGKHAWLTREVERVNGRDLDPFTNYTFTVSAYLDLFRMLGQSNSARWFKDYPKKLRTLILSGDMDPVGKYGKGPDYVYKHLLKNQVGSVELKLYPDARHELFNETEDCREEVFSDIVSFLEKLKK